MLRWVSLGPHAYETGFRWKRTPRVSITFEIILDRPDPTCLTTAAHRTTLVVCAGVVCSAGSMKKFARPVKKIFSRYLRKWRKQASSRLGRRYRGKVLVERGDQSPLDSPKETTNEH
jgi:hypothetical protein